MYFCNISNDVLPSIELASRVFDESCNLFRVMPNGKLMPYVLEKSDTHFRINTQLNPLETAVFIIKN